MRVIFSCQAISNKEFLLVIGVDLFFALFNNLAMFIALVAIYNYLIVQFRQSPWYRRQLFLGLAFGLFAVGCMYARIPVYEGVIVDQRNAIIALSGVFGGPVAACISAACAGIFRLYLGGQGAIAGVVGACLAATSGIVLSRCHNPFGSVPRAAASAFFATLVIIPGFLFVEDFQVGLALMKSMSAPYGLAIFLCIFLVGLLLHREEDKIEVERQLLESEERFRALAETSPLAIYMSEGVEQKAEYINPTFVNLFGYTLEEVPSVDHWWPLAYPDEKYRKSLIGEWQDKIEHAIKRKLSIEPMEVIVTCKDGSEKNISWGFTSVGSQNWAFGLDITARVKAKNDYQRELSINVALADLGRSLISPELPIKDIADKVLEKSLSLTSSEHGYVSEINPTSGENVGHTLTSMLGDACKMEGPDVRMIFPSGEEGKLLGHALNTGIPFFTNSPQEDPRYTSLPEGHVPVARLLSIPVTYENEIIGQIALANSSRNYTNEDIAAIQRLADLYALAIYRDRARLERIALEAQTIRSSQLATLGELSAGVAHEINNPICGVINYAQIILNKSNEGSLEEDISNRIIKEGNRIAVIVCNLLSFSRQEDSKYNYNDIHSLIDVTLSLLGKKLGQDGIVIETVIDTNIPQIQCNAQQIEQVLLNLIVNSQYSLNKKYPQLSDKKKIEIRANPIMKKDKPFISLTVKDYGVGIPDKVLPNIFKTFYTTKESGMGTGLGLSIVEGIVISHGGKIYIESKEGFFTNVIIEIPVQIDKI